MPASRPKSDKKPSNKKKSGNKKTPREKIVVRRATFNDLDALVELAPGVTLDDINANTEASFQVALAKAA